MKTITMTDQQFTWFKVFFGFNNMNPTDEQFVAYVTSGIKSKWDRCHSLSQQVKRLQSGLDNSLEKQEDSEVRVKSLEKLYYHALVRLEAMYPVVEAAKRAFTDFNSLVVGANIQVPIKMIASNQALGMALRNADAANKAKTLGQIDYEEWRDRLLSDPENLKAFKEKLDGLNAEHQRKEAEK